MSCADGLNAGILDRTTIALVCLLRLVYPAPETFHGTFQNLHVIHHITSGTLGLGVLAALTRSFEIGRMSTMSWGYTMFDGRYYRISIAFDLM